MPGMGLEETHIAQTSLPRHRNLVGAIVELGAILAVELTEGIKVVDETDVVALHNNARGDHDAEHDGLGIQLDALQQGHLLLLGRGGTRVVDNALVRLDSGRVIVQFGVLRGSDIGGEPGGALDDLPSHCGGDESCSGSC